ncbi:MAG: hypothetical protein HDS13_09860 [Bacteroides sp.]|nr:hypothetical protein [Bacteroides sp.]
MNIRKFALAGIGCLTAVIPAFSADIEFSYAEGDTSRFGTKKTENYDVAIRLFDPGFTGNTIKGFSVPVCTEGISNVRLWLSTELKIETVGDKRVNVVDIVEVPVTVGEDGIASVELETPYVITDGGVYVGYSFDIDELTDATMYPVMTGAGSNPDGLYMHTERTYRKWVDFASDFQLCSCLTVNLETPDYENAAGISDMPLVRAMIGEPFTQSVVIANHGTQPINSIDYSYIIEDKTGDGSIVLDVPVPAQYNSKGTVEIPMPAVGSQGQVDFTITVTKVNGIDNPDLTASANGIVNVLSVVPIHRAVMEEYTGTWCGFCVRGFAAMEALNDLYPQDFIALAYHNKDPMAIMSSYPNSFDGFPYSFIDRTIGCDPYFGTSGSNFGIQKVWLTRCESLAPAAVNVTADWDNDDTIKVSAVTTFIEVPQSAYALAYYLVEDDMHGDSKNWLQSNYYANGSNGSADKFIPEMRQFVEGESYVAGLKFDDVVVMTSNMRGIEGSLDGVEMDVPFEHEYSFEAISEALNVYGNPVVQDKSKLRAVVLLLDTATGQIVNAAKTGYIYGASVENVDGSAEVTGIEYYDMTGLRCLNPSDGIFIRLTRMSDGSVRTSKVVF